MRPFVLFLCLSLASYSSFAYWEELWQVGDVWVYRVDYREKFLPFTGIPFHASYELRMAVVEGKETRFPGWEEAGFPKVWSWTLTVEDEKYGFPRERKATVFVFEKLAGVRFLRFPLPAIFLWEGELDPEEAGALVGILWVGGGPALWEREIPLEIREIGLVGKVVQRLTIEPLGEEELEVAGSLFRALRFEIQAETRREFSEKSRTVRIHRVQAWGSDKVRNWIRIEGQEEENGIILRQYSIELVSFAQGK